MTSLGNLCQCFTTFLVKKFLPDPLLGSNHHPLSYPSVPCWEVCPHLSYNHRANPARRWLLQGWHQEGQRHHVALQICQATQNRRSFQTLLASSKHTPAHPPGTKQTPKNCSAPSAHVSFSELDLAEHREDFIVNGEKGCYQLHGNPASWDWRPFPGSAAATPPKVQALLIFNAEQGRGKT